MDDTRERQTRSMAALRGLSVGDTFGEQFFIDPDLAMAMIVDRAVPTGPWRYTDDTLMALSVVETLLRHDSIRQDALALSFARHYDNTRGYGPTMHGQLERLRHGEDWRIVSPSMFGASGSMGNGAAMRVAPVGAYFADDMDRVVAEARRSAVVTHHHPEGVAGAIAVAVAAALAALALGDNSLLGRDAFLGRVEQWTPESEVRAAVRNAINLGDTCSVRHAVSVLGNGRQCTAPDTVPFALWCAANNLGDYASALWMTVEGLGDRDTTCAIVGGIVALSAGSDAIPTTWLSASEPWPAWFQTITTGL